MVAVSNWTNQTSNLTDFSDLVPFTRAELTLVNVIQVILWVLGVVGNISLMLVLRKLGKQRSLLDIFIFSLCFADLCSSSISWLDIYIRTWGYSDFDLPSFLCATFWSINVWMSYVTSLHILSYAVLRFVAVYYPVKIRQITSMTIKVWVAAIWVGSFLCGFVPMFVFSGIEERPRFTNVIDSTWPLCAQRSEWIAVFKSYTRYAYPIFFYIPIVVTAVVSVGITFILLKRRREVSGTIPTGAMRARVEREKMAFIQLSVIVQVFLLGYIPFTAYEFFTTTIDGKTMSDWQTNWRFDAAQNICMRLSDCLNPLLYTLTSRKLKVASANLFGSVCPSSSCCHRGFPTVGPSSATSEAVP